MAAKDITGNRYGRLVAISRKEKSKNGSYLWECKCDCGNITKATTSQLNSGNTKSCGCSKKHAAKNKENFHGMRGTRVYNSWVAIKARCYSESCKVYPMYGGSGIIMEEEWRDSFLKFYEYIGHPPEDGNRYTIDRIDNSEGYIKGNIRWATSYQQARNKGKNKNNRSGVTGVCWGITKYNGGAGSTRCAIASWRRLDGKLSKSYYSVKKYGEELAFFLACERREVEILRLNMLGAGYSEDHGK